MAGKKGMKQARPKTQEERDEYALNKIEYLLDKVIFAGKELSTWDATRMAALKIRYDKLRATKTQAEITKVAKWSDAIMNIQERKQGATSSDAPPAQEPVSPEQQLH